MYSNRGNGVPK
jgi:hypothetical protein